MHTTEKGALRMKKQNVGGEPELRIAGRATHLLPREYTGSSLKRAATILFSHYACKYRHHTLEEDEKR